MLMILLWFTFVALERG